MLHSPTRALLAAVWVGSIQAAVTYAGPPPSEKLLPASTKAYVSVPDVPELVESWNKTQLGQLLDDPAMKSFGEDLRRQLREKWTESHGRLGLSIEDVQDLATGELSVAILHRPKTQASVAVLVDVTGNEDRALETIRKVVTNLAKGGGRQSQQKMSGATVTVFEFSPDDRRRERQAEPDRAVYFVKEGLLCASDSLSVAAEILKQWGGAAEKSLAGLPAFEAVMARAGRNPRELSPHLRWFIDPLGLAEAARTWSAPRRGDVDYLEVFQKQGFTAVKGMGGFVNFATDRYGVLHRTVVYAPPPYELAMRMMVFPNGGDFTPQTWVPRDVATYMAFQWNLLNAFDRFGTLFDEIYGEEGVWQDTLDSIVNDPNGPQIDLRKDLVAHLGQRVSILTDYESPITPTSERRLLAVETTNPKQLAETIEKSMQGDPRVRRRKVGEVVVWEMIAEEQALPVVNVQQPGQGGRQPSGGASVATPNSAVSVAKGHLLVASHISLLEKVLQDIPAPEQLVADGDFQRVQQHVEKLAVEKTSARGFARTDEQFRATYEMFRAGRLPELDTFFARTLNIVLGEGKEGVIRKPKLDGSKLPDYKVVERYLGPAGSFVTSDEDGWFIMGFTLGTETPLVTGAGPSDTTNQ